MKKGDAMKQEKRIYIRKYVSAIIFSNIIVWFSWALPLILLDGIKLNDESLLQLGFLLRIVLSTIPFIVLFDYTKRKYKENKFTKMCYICSIISMLLLPTLFFILHLEIGYGGWFW